jgi:two-component system sensor histidine kinase and response regulator WspE
MIDIDPTMFELFRDEVQGHTTILARGLLDFESDLTNRSRIEPLMRAAHSIKGAARIVGIELAVRLAHVMEDVFVAAQNGAIVLSSTDVDALLQGSDILAGLATLRPERIAPWEDEQAPAIQRLEPLFEAIAAGKAYPLPPSHPSQPLLTISDQQESRDKSDQAIQLLAARSDPDFPPAPPFTPQSLSTDSLSLPADHSMLALFREEIRSNLVSIQNGLERGPEQILDNLKQIRGAARIMKCAPIERVARALCDFANLASQKRLDWSTPATNWLSYAFNSVAGILDTDEESFGTWLNEKEARFAEICDVFERVNRSPRQWPALVTAAVAPSEHAINPLETVAASSGITVEPPASPPPSEAVVRVTAQSLNRLMGLAGESLVQARWLPSFSTGLLGLRKQHDLLISQLDRAYHSSTDGMSRDQLRVLIANARRQALVCRKDLLNQALDFDDHAARAEDLNSRLYREVIVSRMRPFGDGIHGLPRLVRDMARSLGKEAKLVVAGEDTEVDRDILEKLESPLSHLVRNAVDHGLETPEARSRLGKPPVGIVRLEARHRAGMLLVTIADNGSGVDLEKLRQKIIERGLNKAEIVRTMTEPELLEFLFLPGFTTATSVSEFSGRGVGLDVVQDTIRKVGGSVRITTAPGRGTTFQLQLPLTLSVIRAVVVEIAGEPYAFPHTRIDRLIRVHRGEVRSLEHRQFISIDGRNVGLVIATQLLELPQQPPVGEELSVVLLSDSTGSYGIVVDSFRGEQDLVVRPLDSRLGKVPNLSAAAILDDGTPVLIVDAEDLLRSTDHYIQTGALKSCDTKTQGPVRKKRVLVVDDSITVREVERQLLMHRGYDVSIAVDGMDGWNKIRADHFDLLVSDIDMPRMSGIQLVSSVRNEEKLRDLPIIIVSYKEREEDRIRGLEVGANCYLTKSSFHDNRFIEAVEDLIGTN